MTMWQGQEVHRLKISADGFPHTAVYPVGSYLSKHGATHRGALG